MKINKQFGMKLVMLLSALFCVNAASADNVLSVTPFTIDSYDTVDMQICLDNTAPIGAFQVEIVLPEELEITGKPVLNADRKNSGMQVQASKLYGVVSNQLKNFKGNTGAIMSVPVKVKEGMLADKTVKIAMKQIVLSSGDGELGVEQPDFDVEVTLVGETYKYSGYTDPAEITIMPGERKEIAFCVTNNGPIWGFQIDAYLPEGLSIDEESGETAERCSEDGFVLITQNTGFTRIALVTYGENSVKDDTFDGAVLKFTLVASDDFTAEKGEVTFSNFIVENSIAPAAKDCPTTPLTVINGKTSGIDAIINDAAMGNAAIYTLDGIKLDAPQAGKINVIVTTNGDVKKVLVK